MGTTNVAYWIMTKPIHSVYGLPVPGKGRASTPPPGLKKEDIETLWALKIKKSCGGGSCNQELYPMHLEPFVVFGVCYSIEEAKRVFKRALAAVGEEHITVLQQVPTEVRIKF